MTGCQGSHKTRPASECLPRQVAREARLAAWGPARWLGLSLQLGRRTPPYLSPGRLTAKPLPAGRAGCPVPAQTRPRALHAFQKQVSVRAPGSAPLCWLAPLQGVLCVASDPGNVFSGPEYLGNIHCMELRPG